MDLAPDLGQLTEADTTQPVDELLDERGVDFGDRYSRDAVEAFSVDDQLQCMPYAVSPMVIYYNTDLIDFDKMQRRGLDAGDPRATTGWTFEQFAAAAQFATRRRKAPRASASSPPSRGWRRSSTPAAAKIFDDSDDAHVAGLLRRRHPHALERTAGAAARPAR